MQKNTTADLGNPERSQRRTGIYSYEPRAVYYELYFNCRLTEHDLEGLHRKFQLECVLVVIGWIDFEPV